MKEPLIIKTGKVSDYIAEIIAALLRQDVVTWIDLKKNKPTLVVSAQNSFGRHDVYIPDGVGHSNIYGSTIFAGDHELKIGQVYK